VRRDLKLLHSVHIDELLDSCFSCHLWKGSKTGAQEEEEHKKKRRKK